MKSLEEFWWPAMARGVIRLAQIVGMMSCNLLFAGMATEPVAPLWETVNFPKFCSDHAILGLFNPQSAVSAERMGARAVRFVLSANEFSQGLGTIADRMATYKHAGFIVVASTTHWNGQKQESLPSVGSADWIALLDEFETFLRTVGPSIDICVLDNEPMFDLASSDLQPTGLGESLAIEWYRAMACRAHAVICSDPKLFHLKISAPALNEIPQEAQGGSSMGDIIAAFLAWENTDPNIEIADVHLHVSSVVDIEVALRFLRANLRRPLIVTEWSQADAAKPWLQLPLDTNFAAKWTINGALTNLDFVNRCYHKSVEKSEWDEFVSSAPYDPKFMNNAFAAMCAGHVILAAYGGEIQIGNPLFDTKQLLADQTVVPYASGNPQENFQFGVWYRALARTAAREKDD